MSLSSYSPEAVDPNPKLPRPAARDDDEVQAISYLYARAPNHGRRVACLRPVIRVLVACLSTKRVDELLPALGVSHPRSGGWWPILRPIYSSGFREFAKERVRRGHRRSAGKNPTTGCTARPGSPWSGSSIRPGSKKATRGGSSVQRSACPDGYVNLARFGVSHAPAGRRGRVELSTT